MGKQQETKQTRTEFLQMNDDCIEFVLNYLCVENLLNIALTCSRLQGLAQSVFSRRGLTLEIAIRTNGERDHNEKYLRIFGAHAKTIRFATKVREDYNSAPALVEQMIECMNRQPLKEKLEHLEIIVVHPLDLLDQLWDLLIFQNMIQSLKVYYSLSISMNKSIGMFRLRNQLTEYVYGYPYVFKPDDLYTIIENGVNLQRLMVIGYGIDRLRSIDYGMPIDSDCYHRMLDVIKNRPNKKPLHVIIIGCDSRRLFLMNFLTQDELRITCLHHDQVIPLLGDECKHYNEYLSEYFMEISAAQVAMLFDHKWNS